MSETRAEESIFVEVPLPDPLEPFANGIIEHMNEDHAEALSILARAHGVTEIAGVTMTGIDQDSMRLELRGPAGTTSLQLTFRKKVTSPDMARIEIIALLAGARKKLGLPRPEKASH